MNLGNLKLEMNNRLLQKVFTLTPWALGGISLSDGIQFNCSQVAALL